MTCSKISLLVVLILTCFGCHDTLELENDITLSNEEKEILEQCRMEALKTKTQIEANLIGNWRLSGYSCGFCSFSEAPNASANFKPDYSGTLNYQGWDGRRPIQSFTWSVKDTIDLNGNPIFILHTEPNMTSLNATVFCQNYLYNTDGKTIADVPIYIYAKE
ncbi:MAG: hypothetical protein Sapg2KO_39380 [Saprospiraceae bacterium]